MRQIDLERAHLLARVSQMYYEQSATQESIAAALSISRPTVSRLLKEAREEGIVEIIVHLPVRYVPELEAQLTRAFPRLHRVQVLQGSDPAAVSRAAAAHVAGILGDGETIGVSWGNTMARLVEHLPAKPLHGATVVQLNGGVARAGSGTNAHDIVTRFGQAFGAEAYYLHVPAIVDSRQVREVLIENRETARVLRLGRTADVAVFGIGALEHESVLVRAGYVTPRRLEELRRRGAVGDICSRYFTADGRPADPDLDARTIGLPLEELGQLQRAVAVAWGAHKAAGVLGALRGRFCTELILDETAAREVLRLAGRGGGARD